MTTPPFDGLDARRRIDRFVADQLPGFAGERVVTLTGDASDRRYVRVAPPAGDPVVLALHAAPIDFATLPFANVQALLDRMALPVPAILGHSDPLGILALEDLGDITLQTHLETATPGERDIRYREAVDMLAVLQRRGAELAGDSYLPYTLRFDVPKLTFELDFCVTHFLEGVRGARLSAAERAAFGEEWALLAGELAAEPVVLCHRDYHSRNLMVHRGRLAIIDFQDARLGPDTYDLVSLLRDSYVGLPDATVNGLIEHFLAMGGHGSDSVRFRERFDRMAVQRNLKALGTFGYQSVTRGNPAYLKYVPRTLGYLRANLATYRRFERLRDLLAEHVPELA